MRIYARALFLASLFVASMRVCNPERSSVGTIAETQPQLKPALLRLSAMISQYFTNPTISVVVLNRLRRTVQCDSIPSSLQRCELLAPPIEMLLRSCPERLHLLLVISVTGVISVGVDNLEPVLHQAEESVERFHQRVMLLFARLAVGVPAAFLLELFDGGLNLRMLLLNQNAERKRAHITDPAQQRRSHDHHRRFRLRIHGRVKQLRAKIFRPQYTGSVTRSTQSVTRCTAAAHTMPRFAFTGNVMETHEQKGDFKEP
jgi:hypothetical protein